MLETKCQENARAIAQQIKGSGASTADAVSYDNTSSGLTATNVQCAVDELATGHKYSTTVKVVGTWIDGKAIMERVFHLETPYQGRSTGGTFPDAVNTVLASADTIISVYGIGDGACVSIGVDTDNDTIKGFTFTDWAVTDLIVQYTVGSPAPIL